ncbi:iron chelate uptake ABC transporter family permease subunit [Rhodobacterales bacterium HKCCE2091]|nr:iron chelate uptake ABC transporter family permease subunit [Rhodobacterales bacterium HKCCE2091]
MAERRLLLLLGLGLAGLSALYLLWHLRPPVDYILPLRATKLSALILVGAASGAATVVFQTVAGNRLLAPGIVGFDALFVFTQTMLVFGLGAAGYATLPALPRFLGDLSVMLVASLLLFGLLLRRGAGDVIRMLLTGVILGALLRGLASFAQRLLEPSEFAVVQQATVASFGSVDRTQLGIAAAVLAAGLGGAMALAPRLDVAALGREKAFSLGVDHDRLTLVALALVAALVSAATALVGPVAFLGLLAASLARAALPTERHAITIPAAAVTGAAILVAGQSVFERFLGLQSTLGVVVEFAGGLLFLALVLRRRPA